MILIDSSALIALFREDEIHFTKAKALFAMEEKLIIPDVVIAETMTVLKIREGHKVVRTCHDFLTENRDIIVRQSSQQEWDITREQFAEEKNKLSFFDTMLLLISQKEHIPLATFDKALQKELNKGN